MKHELTTVCSLIKQAGDRALELQQNGFEVQRKKDGSPVTTGDLEVNRILQEGLLRAYPQDGWLSEENADTAGRAEKSRVWIVDPIDGTKYFMKRVPQFSISVALVEDEQPVVGVVFNPATGELFSAVRGRGAYLNGQPISALSSQQQRLHVLVNPSRLKRGEFRSYEERADCQPMGSIAYTLALVAAGKADAVLNFDLLNEWDIAAGLLLVEEAGGTTRDNDGKRIVFNQPNTRVNGIIAATKGLDGRVNDLIAKAGDPRSSVRA